MKQKLDRQDILPEGRAPRSVRKFLHNVGGVNPYGEDNYRLVLAQAAMILRGGEWFDWPEETEIEDQGGISFSEGRIASQVLSKLPGTNLQIRHELEGIASAAVSEQAPLRVVKEMRWIRRYPNLNGWILMHWDPPSAYGSRAWWESHRVKGAPELMILGPFPERGDYEQTAQWGVVGDGGLSVQTAVLQEIPSLTKLQEAVEAREYQRNNEVLSGNEDWRKVTRLNELRAQQEEETRKRKEYKRAYIRDKMKPYWANSLEAGRLREELAKRAGMRQHVGN